MKSFKSILLTALLLATASAPLTGSADDAKPVKTKPRPYVLSTCIVSGDKFGGDADMKPFVYVYKDKKIKDDPGREIKFCCKDCVKDFNKDTAAFLKKIDLAEAKEKEKAKK